jgi:hypothetical protein
MQAYTVLPGMNVFTGSAGRYKIHQNCLVVRGRGSDGKWQELYRNACPRRGFVWRQDPIDHLMHHVTNTSWPAVLEAEAPLEAPVADSLRRFVALGDYFCHSSYVDAPPRQEIAVHNRLLLVRYADGALVSSPTLQCRYTCLPDVFAVPRCQQLAADEKSAVRAP